MYVWLSFYRFIMCIISRKIFLLYLRCCISISAFSQKKEKTNGNPIFSGKYADLGAIVYGNEYILPCRNIQNNDQYGRYWVAYAISDSPFGPFKRIRKILQQDEHVATGAGHHSVIQIPGKDEWYVIYHRRPLGNTNQNHQETCIDRMCFDEKRIYASC